MEPSIASASGEHGPDTSVTGPFHMAIRTMQSVADCRADTALFRLADALTALFDSDPGYALEMLLDWYVNEVRP